MSVTVSFVLGSTMVVRKVKAISSIKAKSVTISITSIPPLGFSPKPEMVGDIIAGRVVPANGKIFPTEVCPYINRSVVPI